MISTRNRSDRDLRRAILEELAWDPRVDHESIHVGVEGSDVALSGRARTAASARAAREAALRVAGVRSVVDELVVGVPSEPSGDADLERRVRDALAWDVCVPPGGIRCEVRDGWVRLEGEVDRWLEREGAISAVVRLEGVRGVSSEIRVRPRIPGGARDPGGADAIAAAEGSRRAI